ncbi:MAG: hypothetical protein IPL32_16645 [Chloracidobacterium sp.]|nr:hypothetical protein [Chloracidobacterium sp.]
MNCSDLQLNLALYSASDAESSTVKIHLEACPLCREQYSEFRAIRNSLQKLRRPEISAELKNSLKQNVRSEIRHSHTARLPVSLDISELLTMRIMPYSVGVCASLLVGLTFLTMMFSGMLKPVDSPASASSGSRDTTIMLASNRNPFEASGNSEISASEYAQTRLGFGGESPSINPQGALIALTKSLVRGGMKDDEVVVVADVFGNGLAQIAEVIEPSRDRRAVSELQKALASDPAFAPFVPTNLENRPESVRVVLKFQSVNVRTNQKQRPTPPQKPTRQ